jgi:hypothetical protein
MEIYKEFRIDIEDIDIENKSVEWIQFQTLCTVFTCIQMVVRVL